MNSIRKERSLRKLRGTLDERRAVYAGEVYDQGGRRRVVAKLGYKNIARILGVPQSLVEAHWKGRASPEEQAAAEASPGVVLVRGDDGRFVPFAGTALAARPADVRRHELATEIALAVSSLEDVNRIREIVVGILRERGVFSDAGQSGS